MLAEQADMGRVYFVQRVPQEPHDAIPILGLVNRCFNPPPTAVINGHRESFAVMAGERMDVHTASDELGRPVLLSAILT